MLTGDLLTDEYIGKLLNIQKEIIKEQNCIVEKFTDFLKSLKLLQKMPRKVIGWFQGKMEWGPMSLETAVLFVTQDVPI